MAAKLKKKKELTEQKLRKLYRLMSVSMTDFDCGKLCAPENNGVPYCCDNERCMPVLFKPEYNWSRKKADFWRKIRPRTKAERKMIDESVSYNVFAHCAGVEGCRRGLRALICRAFPFEPHVDKEGKVVGLVFQDGQEGNCPLTKKPRHVFNKKYIFNAMKFWQEIIDIYEPEKELYIGESRKRKQRQKKQGKKYRLFKA